MSLLRNVSYTVLGNILVRVMGILVTGLIFRAFPPETLGAYQLAIAWFSNAIVLTQLGHSQFLILCANKGGRSEDIAEVIFYRMVVAGALTLGGLGWALASDGDWRILLAVVMLALPFGALTPDWQVQAQNRYGQLAMVAVLAQVLVLGVAGIAFWSASPIALGLVQSLMTIFLGVGAVFIIGWSNYLRTLRHGLGQFRRPLAALRNALTRNIGFTYVYFMLAIAMNMDMIFADFMLCRGELGYFSALNRMLFSFISVQSLISQTIYSHMVSRRPPGWKVVALNLGIGLGVAAVMLAIPTLLVTLLFGAGYVDMLVPLCLKTALVPPSAALFFTVLQQAFIAAPTLPRQPGRMAVMAVSVVAVLWGGYQLSAGFGISGMVALVYVKWLALAILCWIILLKMPGFGRKVIDVDDGDV